MKLLVVAFILAASPFIESKYEDRYDLRRLPYDLRPIAEFIGLWELQSRSGNTREFAPPDLIDIAINPLPKFGARAANITHSYFDREKNVIRSEYGFMPVKNATKRDPRIHVAYLTTSSEGFSMMEQGTVRGNKLTFHLKQFLRRTFDVGSTGVDLDIREFERQFELLGFRHMIMKVRAETALGIEGFTANYRKNYALNWQLCSLSKHGAIYSVDHKFQMNLQKKFSINVFTNFYYSPATIDGKNYSSVASDGKNCGLSNMGCQDSCRRLPMSSVA